MFQVPISKRDFFFQIIIDIYIIFLHFLNYKGFCQKIQLSLNLYVKFWKLYCNTS